jgi:hypothetical protein
MDWTNEGVTGVGTCDKVYLTSSADFKEVPREDRKVEDEEGLLPTLRRTTNSTHLNRLNRLDRLWLTSTDDEKTHIFTPSRSSSCSSEEIVFRGRANHGRAISIERVLGALSGLSMADDEDKNEVGRHDTKVPDLLDDYSTGQEDIKESRHSEDVRHLIPSQIRPSLLEDLEAERDNTYRGIDLNEGWNQAALRGLKEHFAEKSLVSNIKIRSDFAGFSQGAQQHLRSVRQDLEKFFIFVFKSTGPVNKPFHTCRSRVLSQRTAPTLISSPPSWFQALSCTPFEYAPGLFAPTIYLFDCPPETISNVCLWICHNTIWQSNPERRAQEADLSRPYQSEKCQCLHLGGQRVYHQNPNPAPRSKRNGLALDDNWRKGEDGRMEL